MTKADLVGEKVGDELRRHRKGASLLLNPLMISTYGLWSMSADEADAVAKLLAQHHTERPAPRVEAQRPTQPDPPAKEPSTTPGAKEPKCKHCSGNDLAARWGKYGYYWKCGACGKNTPMPTRCRACDAVGQRGNKVRIRKEGAKYFRDCQECLHSEQIWTAT